MFLILIKYVDNGKTTWAVEGEPFERQSDAVDSARKLAVASPNVFAVASVTRMFQTRTAVLEITP